MIFTLALTLALISSAQGAETLDHVYRAALQKNPALKAEVELSTQAKEHYTQAIGGMLPALSLNGSYFRQADAPTVATLLNPGSQTTAKFTLTQALFRGTSEYAGIRQTRRLEEAQRAAEANQHALLYTDVVGNFVLIHSLETDAENLDAEIKLYDQRVKELDKRVRIGRSRSSEILGTQANLVNLQAQLEDVRGQLMAARNTFNTLTGLAPETQLAEPPQVPAPVPPLQVFLDGIENRHDIRESKLLAEASDEGVAVARGAHFPSADFLANYYLQRTGSLADVNWDLLLTASIPIFAGGATQSKVRESLSKRNQSEIALANLRDQATLNVRKNYQSLISDLAQIDAYEKALVYAQKSYAEETRDYRLGLVTNLNVLQAMTSELDNRRSLDRSKSNARLHFLLLETEAGRAPLLTQAEAQ